MTIGYTQGTFDMFHVGHLRLLMHAHAQCDHLIVGVNSDELVNEYKHHRPIIPAEERAEIIQALSCVDEVIIADTLDKAKMLDKLHFQKIFIGDDWKGNSRWEATGKIMAERGVELVFLPHTKGVSSTGLAEKLYNRLTGVATDNTEKSLEHV